MDDIVVPECAVCLQSCNHPAKLPCGHIFCFLCMKGVAIRNKRCAMCRHDIPPDYLDNPVLLSNEITSVTNATTDENIESFQWYYEGRNGWWRYDERSNMELESAHDAGASSCQLLLAGALYYVDFNTMLQYRRNDITRRRRVKRDVTTAPAKGVAGIKMESTETEDTKNVENEDNVLTQDTEDVPDVPGSSNSPESSDITEGTSQVIIPPPPQFDIVQSIRSLSIAEEDHNEE